MHYHDNDNDKHNFNSMQQMLTTLLSGWAVHCQGTVAL